MTEPCVDLACEHAVLRALDLAAKRSRNVARSERQAIPGIPPYLTHTKRRLAYTSSDCDRLLDGAWDLLVDVLCVLPHEHAERVITAVDAYARDLILTQSPPTSDRLREYLQVAYEPAT